MNARANALCLIIPLLYLSAIPSLSSAGEEKQASPNNVVMFNGRLLPNESSAIFTVPSGRILMITDVMIQNKGPGDQPVDPSQYSRIVVGQVQDRFELPKNEHDIFFTVIGNEMLNLHLTTGLRATQQFRVGNWNSGSNSNVLIEFTITGYLTH